MGIAEQLLAEGQWWVAERERREREKIAAERSRWLAAWVELRTLAVRRFSPLSIEVPVLPEDAPEDWGGHYLRVSTRVEFQAFPFGRDQAGWISCYFLRGTDDCWHAESFRVPTAYWVGKSIGAGSFVSANSLAEAVYLVHQHAHRYRATLAEMRAAGAPVSPGRDSSDRPAN